MRTLMIAALLAQAITDQAGARCYEGRGFGTAQAKEIPCPKLDTTILVRTPAWEPPWRPGESASDASAVLGGVIEVTALEGQPTGEWMRVEMGIKRTARKPHTTYEVDYVRSTTVVDAKHRPVWSPPAKPSDACAAEMLNAIERVREAWAPRFSSRAPSWNPNLWGNLCASECLSVTTTGGLPHDDSTSAACYRCLADAKDARDEAAKERAEKERRARAALDAVDEACGGSGAGRAS